MYNFAINGFGRIGRMVFRAWHSGKYDNLNCVIINAGMGDLDTYLHLLRYDSVHGYFHAEGDNLTSTIKTARGEVKVIFHMDPKTINWQGVDFVLECTGAFTKKDLAIQHLHEDVKAVLVSAPCDNADATVVYGINHHVLDKNKKVISIGSCTTNCLAPIAAVLDEHFIIEKGFMSTVHAYTNDQSLVDSVHKDKRRARAAACSMIPSSTGAAKAIGLVLPQLAGKLDGVAIRVPTPNVSLVDLKVVTKKTTTVDEVNYVMKEASQKLAGVLAYTEEELVSTDFNGNSHSSIFDATQTKVLDGNLLRVAAWYDNEWGFSNRVLDVLAHLGNKYV